MRPSHAKRASSLTPLKLLALVASSSAHGADGKVHRNSTDGCWTGCLYDTARGPQSNATAYPAKNTCVGMSSEALVEAWVKDVKSCPQV